MPRRKLISLTLIAGALALAACLFPQGKYLDGAGWLMVCAILTRNSFLNGDH